MHVNSKIIILFISTIFYCSAYSQPAVNECQNWQTNHPEWIFCDDFESSGPLVDDRRYFEIDTVDNQFSRDSNIGVNDSYAMRAIWNVGDVNAGNLKLGFGRNPVAYMDKGNRNTEDFREVYYRLFLKMQNGWQGNPEKLSRATVIAKNNWGQAMSANTWQGSNNELGIDPTSCVYTISTDDIVTCEGYNDFTQRYFLGYKSGKTAIFDTSAAGQWQCIEVHVKLNDTNETNGIHEVWINDVLEISSTNLNFVKNYDDYGINAIFFENYWNAGSPKVQERYFDNIVVSTERIGCKSTIVTNNNPTTTVTNSTATTGDDSGGGTLNIYILLLALFIYYRRKSVFK